jgi:hypothetical protein
MGAVDKPQQKTLTNAGIRRTVAVKTVKAELPIGQGVSGPFGQQTPHGQRGPGSLWSSIANVGIDAIGGNGPAAFFEISLDPDRP